MEQLGKLFLMYNCDELALNKIGDAGCKYLVKAEW